MQTAGPIVCWHGERMAA